MNLGRDRNRLIGGCGCRWTASVPTHVARALLPVSEHDPDLAASEGHPLAVRGGEGGAALQGGPRPAGGPGLAVAQDQRDAGTDALRVRRGLAVLQEP